MTKIIIHPFEVEWDGKHLERGLIWYCHSPGPRTVQGIIFEWKQNYRYKTLFGTKIMIIGLCRWSCPYISKINLQMKTWSYNNNDITTNKEVLMKLFMLRQHSCSNTFNSSALEKTTTCSCSCVVWIGSG